MPLDIRPDKQGLAQAPDTTNVATEGNFDGNDEPTAFQGEDADDPSADSNDSTSTDSSSTDTTDRSNDTDNAGSTSADTDTKSKLPTFDAFLKARDRNDDAPAPAAKPTTKPTEGDQNQAKSKQVVQRDYSIFDEPDREVFRKTSNEAFSRIEALYKENKELKSKAETATTGKQIYDHPHAYALSEEYQQISANANLAAAIEDHWERQLIAAEQGQPWQDIDIDPKTGRLVKFGEPQPVNAENITQTKIQLNKFLRAAQHQSFRQQEELTKLQTSYKTGYEADAGNIKKLEQQYFKVFTEDEKVGKDFKAATEGILKELPARFRSHPLASLLAHTGAALRFIAADNKQLRAGQQTAAAVKKDAAAAPPTKGKFVNGAGGGAKKNISFSDFQRAKERVE